MVFNDIVERGIRLVRRPGPRPLDSQATPEDNVVTIRVETSPAVDIEITGEALAALEERASAEGVPVSEILARAISLQKFLFDETERGSRVVLENDDRRELVAV